MSCIRWGAISDSCPRAVVKCCDGEEFPADYVIVTVSLGVLKHQHDKLFCPALPAEKVEAICKLGYGYVNKIFLEYARPFWVWKEGGIKLAWSADELADRCDWVKGTLSLFFNVPLTDYLETWREYYRFIVKLWRIESETWNSKKYTISKFYILNYSLLNKLEWKCKLSFVVSIAFHKFIKSLYALKNIQRICRIHHTLPDPAKKVISFIGIKVGEKYFPSK